MAKTIKITLGGKHFSVPQFNVAQIERMIEAFDLPPRKILFEILKIALERADPPVDAEAFPLLQLGFDEMKDTVAAILKFSGLEDKSPNGEAPPAGPN